MRRSAASHRRFIGKSSVCAPVRRAQSEVHSDCLIGGMGMLLVTVLEVIAVVDAIAVLSVLTLLVSEPGALLPPRR